MKSQSPTRIALILIGSLILTGCALKPKQRNSRFHQASSNGSCNCYTCQHSAGSVASNVVVYSQPTASTWVESSEVVSTPAESNELRQPYEVPEVPQETAEPVVSSEPFTTSSPLFGDEQPIIQEVQPGFDSGKFELSNKEDENSLGGGSFKPLQTEDIVEAPKVEESLDDKSSKPLMVEPFKSAGTQESAQALQSPEPLEVAEPTLAAKVADEVAPGPIEAAKPIEITKPVEIAKPVEVNKPVEITKPVEVSKPVEITKPVEVAKPVEVSKPVEVTKTIEIPKPIAEVSTPAEIPKKIEIPKKVEVPAPASTFVPGKAFKPRKKVKPLDTSWLGPDSLDQAQFENSPSDELLVSSPAPVQNDDSINTFFGRQATEAKPLPQPNANGKIVLKANPVERNVVYCPPSASASKVAVPALQAGFKKQNTAGNWLRRVANERPATTQIASAVPCKNGSCSDNASESRVTEIVAAAKNPEAVPAVLQAPTAIESNEPKRLAVKLRAIPMTDQMIRGQRVDVRFREHQPTQRQSQNVIVEAVPSQQPQLIAEPLNETVATPVVALNPQVDLLEINPAIEKPVLNRTARSTDAVEETATPPWRLK